VFAADVFACCDSGCVARRVFAVDSSATVDPRGSQIIAACVTDDGQSLTRNFPAVTNLLADRRSARPGPEPKLETVADFIGPVAFGPPLWAGVYATYDAASNAYAAPDAPFTEDGWRIKILFLLEPKHDSDVELIGHGVRGTERAVLFSVEGAPPAEVASFDPGNPAIPVQHDGWREYPTYVYFPSAGCFLPTASWTGGTSELGFGLGRWREQRVAHRTMPRQERGTEVWGYSRNL